MAESGMAPPFGDGNGGSRYEISKKKKEQMQLANEKRSGRNVVSKSCLDIAIMMKAFTFGVFFSLLHTSFVDGVAYNTFTVAKWPVGIDVDSLGNIWVANNGANTVTKLAPNGTTLGTFTVGSGPRCLAIDNQNRVWITNYNYGTVSVLPNSGASITSITVGSYPYGITTDKSGNIWVVNYGINNVMKLSSSDVGTILGTFSTGNHPLCIAFDSNNHAWITNSYDGTLMNLDNNGDLIGTFTLGSGGTNPIGIAVDSNDDVWAVDYNGAANGISVYKFSNDGTQIGSYSAGNHPNGIAIDSNNNAWIANYWDSTVTKLSNSGIQLALYNVGVSPQFLAFDLSGNAWVTDYGADTVTEIVPVHTSAPTMSPTTPKPTTRPTTSSPKIAAAEFDFIVAGIPIIIMFFCGTMFLFFRRRRNYQEMREVLRSETITKPQTGVGEEVAVSISLPGASANVYSKIEMDTEMPSPQPGEFLFAFLVHNGSEKNQKLAGMIQSILERQTKQKIMVYGRETDANIPSLLGWIEKSKKMIVLLSNDIFRRPTCLIEINHALSLKIPIVCVVLEGDRYDPKETQDFLIYLDSKLDSKSIKLIKKYSIDVVEMAFRLSNIIPTCPTKIFNFGENETTRIAQLYAITTAVQGSRFKDISKSKGTWLTERTVNAPTGNSKTNDSFLAFVSHHKVTAAEALAVNIKKAMESNSASGGKVFVDQEEGHLNKLLKHLQESRVVILLLTKEVLYRPYCLLELNHAIIHKKPIVTVNVIGEGYDFGEAEQRLTNLDSSLDASALKLIKESGIDILDVAYHLSNVIPKIIAKPYNFSYAERIREAQLDEIQESVRTAQFNGIEIPKEVWLAGRSELAKSNTASSSVKVVSETSESDLHSSIPIATVVPEVVNWDSATVPISIDDETLSIWRKRFEQLQRFYKKNDVELAKKSKGELKEYTLEVFEDFSFETIIKSLQTRYPGSVFPDQWLGDLDKKNDIGIIQSSILSKLKNE